MKRTGFDNQTEGTHRTLGRVLRAPTQAEYIAEQLLAKRKRPCQISAPPTIRKFSWETEQ